jgi:DnaJ-class molecular chaperone
MNLLYSANVSILSILCGDPIAILSLDTKETFHIHPKMDNMEKNIVVIPGKGMKRNDGRVGDLYVRLDIKMIHVTESQKQAIRNEFKVPPVTASTVTPCIPADEYKKRSRTEQSHSHAHTRAHAQQVGCAQQ